MAINRGMTNVRTRMICYAKGAFIVLWLFAAPVLLVCGLRVFFPPSEEPLAPAELYALFFLGTWFWSFYWVYRGLFKLAEARWPENALQVRQIKETTDMVLLLLIFAPWGKT
jgi:hypothetical protein